MGEDERKKVYDEIAGAKNSVGSAAFSTAVMAGELGGFATYKMAVTVANAVAMALLGRGLTVAGGAALTRVLGFMLGPVGWALSIVWTAFDLGSPAYRVTVPCVVHVAYMRQKAILNKTTVLCTAPQCGQRNAWNLKFCGQCGAKLDTPAALEATSVS